MELTVIFATLAAAGLFLALGAVHDDRRARHLRVRAASPRRELPLLHSINDDRCIGCEACVAVCPTKVLELVDHKARVIRFQDCVQCEQCANHCPTTALVMYREGSQPQTLTVPELDDRFQTPVPGQYLIGEVAGKPLVKNAANLGRAVVEQIARDLAGRTAARSGGDVVDVLIVGSGPGGLSAALTCRKTGLSCLVLEKEHVLSSTVARYPKGKHFMAEPSNAPNLSYLPVFDASKEALVAAWQRMVDATALPIRLGEAVEGVRRGDDGIFEVTTTVARYRGRTVVLATGLRGKPRLLAVPGANLEKVQARLDDPSAFAGQDVLVVGGGDSAVEAAMSLAEAGARVTLSYRGDSFKRTKQANQRKLAGMEAAGELAIHLGSNVVGFTADQATVRLSDGSEAVLPNRQAFVLIGADTPVAWLQQLGVRFVERPHLFAMGRTEDAVRRVAAETQPCAADVDQAIAVVLGRPAPRTRRLRTKVGEIAHDVSGVVGEVLREVSVAVRRSASVVEEAEEPDEITEVRPPPWISPPPRRVPPPRRPPTVEEPTWVDWVKEVRSP
jgi:thioredoxin reductase/ferredoxin